MRKKSECLEFSFCPYTNKWCFKRKVGDIITCSKCEIEIKYKEVKSMKMVNGIDLDKEIREGWTIQDFINEIDDLIFDVFIGNSIHRVPKTKDELSDLIENLIPKQMFTSQKQINNVVKDLTKIYVTKYDVEE